MTMNKEFNKNMKERYNLEELVPIAMQLARQFAGLESSSVTYEKAGQMMDAVMYCVDTFIRSKYETYDDSCDLLVNKDQEVSAKEAYELGYELLKQEVEQLRLLYNKMMETFDDFGNRCLSDTVRKGIPEFLKWYDIRFAPQDTILTLDYPILAYYKETGVHEVYRYIQYVQLEQIFLRKFDKSYINQVLSQYQADFRGMIENIAEPVFYNVLAHLLVKKDIMDSLTEHDFDQLTDFTLNSTEQDMDLLFTRLLQGFMLSYYKENSSSLTEYMKPAVKNLIVRMRNAAKNDTIASIWIFL